MKKVLCCLISFILIFTLCACAQTEDPEEIISVNVNLKIYNKIFTGFPLDYTLPDYVLSIEKINDDLAVYTIKRKDHEKDIGNIKETRITFLDSYKTEYADFINSVSYNEDLTKIVVTLDKYDYENVSYEYGSAWLKTHGFVDGCVWNTAMYHMYSTGDFKEYEVRVIDNITGDVIEIFSCPDALFEE